MKSTSLAYLFLIGMVWSCTPSSEGELTLQQKKEQLKTYQSEFQQLKEKMGDLEKQIEIEDPAFKSLNDKSILVAVQKLLKKKFIHKIEVRGEVQSRKNVIVSAEVPGVIEFVHVKAGDEVTKGDKLFSLNSSVLRNNINEVKTSLEMAEIIFAKQERLWKQNIGTELQYLEAKNSRDATQNRLNTLYSQLAQYTIEAPFSGRVDLVNARVGEMASPGVPLIRLMNPDDMNIKSDISENFSGNFKTGDPVTIILPGLDTTFNSEIISIGQVINEQNRTYVIEYHLPKLSRVVKPNLVAIIELKDYENPDTFTIPTSIVLKDAKGKYVFTTSKAGEGLVAEKTYIQVGLSFSGETEVLSGLVGTENIILDGYRDLAEGYAVKVSDKNELSWK